MIITTKEAYDIFAGEYYPVEGIEVKEYYIDEDKSLLLTEELANMVSYVLYKNQDDEKFIGFFTDKVIFDGPDHIFYNDEYIMIKTKETYIKSDNYNKTKLIIFNIKTEKKETIFIDKDKENIFDQIIIDSSAFLIDKGIYSNLKNTKRIDENFDSGRYMQHVYNRVRK